MQSTATIPQHQAENASPAPVNSEARNAIGVVSRYREIEPEHLLRAKLGEPQAMTELVRLYEARVFAFLSRATGSGSHVEDLAQEVFLRVFRALPRYNPGEAKFSTWIFQIAVRLVQDRRKRVTPILVAVDDSLRATACSPEASIDDKRRLGRVSQLAEELPDPLRMALILSEFHGLSHEEVARVMGCPRSTVKTRVHRAREFLRSRLAKFGGGELR